MAAKAKSGPKALTLAQFDERMKLVTGDWSGVTDIAVALSGGGDSMALTNLLSRWCAKKNLRLHALTVDHGLRAEAAAEARQVARWVGDWNLTHKILKWTGEKPVTKIQEEARAARYRLLSEYCLKKGIRFLFLAHHANDQVETILFRLAKGSGLDGLSGMLSCQDYNQDLTLVRPFLDVTHDQLIATCKTAKIEWVEDKSNVSDRYARIRLRKSMDVLEAEGLSASRIMTLGSRLERARKALDQLTDIAWNNCALEVNTKRIVLSFSGLFEYPEEIFLRVLMRALQSFRRGKAYPPRLENLETLVQKIYDEGSSFKAATLGGCVIRLKRREDILTLEPEQATKT